MRCRTPPVAGTIGHRESHTASRARRTPRGDRRTATAARLPDRNGARSAAVSGGLGETLLAGILAGYGVAVPVGAIAALLVSLAARTSLRVGAAAALGVATADGLYCAVAVVGGTAVARLIEPVSGPLRWAAMVVLLGLAARTAWTAWRHHRERRSEE